MRSKLVVTVQMGVLISFGVLGAMLTTGSYAQETVERESNFQDENTHHDKTSLTELKHVGVKDVTPRESYIDFSTQLEVYVKEKKYKEEQELLRLEKIKQDKLEKRKQEEQRKNEEKKKQINKHGVYIGQIFDIEATAYTAYCKGCSGITKTGADVRKNFSNVVAVDPSLIPLHTTVEVKVDGNSMGYFKALDIGGDIKGHRIDILHKTKEEALNFGRKQVEVTIVAVAE